MKFIRYLCVGCSTAIIQFLALGIALNWLHFENMVAAGTAYVTAVCFHYFSNRYFTFQMTGEPNIKEILRYLTIVILNCLLTLWITNFSIENLYVSPYMGTFFSILATVGISFFFAGRWIFTSTQGDAPPYWGEIFVPVWRYINAGLLIKLLLMFEYDRDQVTLIYKIRHIPTIWWVITIFTIIEFYFFRAYIVENIEFFYPINFDQSSYLTLSYSTFENVKQYGLVSGIQKSLRLVTGMLFPIQTIFFYLVFGASRFISLLPNFIYFILLQIFSLIAVRSISKKLYISLICLAFILSVNVPFRVSGGLMDFRMDFIAFCLYGMVLASTVKSKIFLDLKWTVVTVFLVIFLILLRFITAIYMISIFWPLVLYFLLMIKASNGDVIRLKENKIRLKNLVLMTGFLTSMVLLYVVINRDVLYNYYMVGHLLGSEKLIRAKELGVTNLLSIISFYPKSIFNDQLGRFWFQLNLLSLLFLCGFYKIKLHINRKDSKELIPWRAGFVLFLLSLFIPLIILTLDVSKSRVVGSIMVIPIIWLIMWCYLYVDSKLKENNRWLTIISVFILLLSFSHQVIKFQPNSIAQTNNLKTITAMYLAIGDYANAHKWSSINLSVDQMCDYLSSGAIETIYYEVRGKILPVAIEQAGGSIFPIKKIEVTSSLKNSNVLIMNLNEYPGGSNLPFNQSITRFRPLMKKYASLYFHSLGDYQFMNSTYRVFVKGKP